MCEMRSPDKWEKRWDLDHTLAASNVFGWGFFTGPCGMQNGCTGQHSTPGAHRWAEHSRYSAPHQAGISKLNVFSGMRKEAPTQQTILSSRWGEKIWQTKLITVSQQSVKRVDALNDRIQGDRLTPICRTAWTEDILPWGRKACLLHTFFFFPF